MRAKHVTSSVEYREPFGAAPVGSTVKLRIDVWDEPNATANLRIWDDDAGETLYVMTSEPLADGGLRFTAAITPSAPGVLWYSFNVTAADGAVWRYGATEERACGEGAFAYGEPPSFQITVYAHTRSVFPNWYKNGIVYQVFPDRFARGADWRERAGAAIGGKLDLHRNGPGRHVVDDWYTTPRYHKSDDGRIAEWSFYGGTLEGVRERLPYLESLGVTVIYLNPIFEAASSHRYDTGDYLRIDPMLGDEESFARLCDDAAARGMSVILDGVFNHTGCDSRYFNRYGNYPELGAYQSADSPYRAWYRFNADAEGGAAGEGAGDGGPTYSCWWGVEDLPDLNEDNPSYRQFICGPDGVVRHWLRVGARGWRLDVADELPDDFIVAIKGAELEEKPDALLIGEVWEDATTKVAYGKLRKYFQGNELDGVMNYPMRHAILDFITNKIGARKLADIMNQLRENYPGEAFFSLLNLLGSHDRVRLMNILGDSPHRSTLSEDERATYKLDDNHRSLAVSRLWVAALMQMTLPGVPCIYYGDEAGMEGYADPYNRGPFPWGREDANCTTIYRNAIAIRKALPVFVGGYFVPFNAGDDVFGYWRYDENDIVCVLVNRSLSNSHTVRVPMRGACVDDVVSGRPVKVVGDVDGAARSAEGGARSAEGAGSDARDGAEGGASHADGAASYAEGAASYTDGAARNAKGAARSAKGAGSDAQDGAKGAARSAKGAASYVQAAGSDARDGVEGGARNVRGDARFAENAARLVDDGAGPAADGVAEAEVFLWPLGTSVLYFHDEARMQATLPHGMGVLAHITSVPGVSDGAVSSMADAGKGVASADADTGKNGASADADDGKNGASADADDGKNGASADADTRKSFASLGAGVSRATAETAVVASLGADTGKGAASLGAGNGEGAASAGAGNGEGAASLGADIGKGGASAGSDAGAVAVPVGTEGQGVRSADGTGVDVATATSGHGTLGAPARAFVDYLAAAGQRYWQILPVNPTDEFGSPYAGLSAFAGNTALLENAAKNIEAVDTGSDAYRSFVDAHKEWLLPYATFRAIKEQKGDAKTWQTWPKRYREWSLKLVEDKRLRESVEHHCREQFEFMRQWSELRSYANERGISIIGDMPMYVSADSADVWAERGIFNLDESGNPALVAGAPPDSMSADGQIWGNPTYRWDVLRAQGYDWWMRRFKRMFELYDYVRLDHFLGFSSYYTIPLGASATEGWWNFGPGVDLFATAYKQFGPLPVIAEDLGIITPAVRALIAATGAPGMDVVQFFDGDPRAGYAPKPGKIVYPSTHDTQTLLGWVEGRYGLGDPQDRASGPAAEAVANELMSACLNSSADVVVVPLQDVLGLDNSARMNVPGVADGNWSWQANAEAVAKSMDRLRKLAAGSNRA